MESGAESSVDETPLRFPALDGYRLGGTLFVPPHGQQPTHAALISTGGGIPASRYANFARSLARSGIAVLTYDYRGIDRSKPKSLRGFVATIEDWSEYDCGGAIAALSENFPDADRVGIAHSIGAFLLAGAPGAGRLARFVFVGAHTGFFGDYRRLYRWPMAFVWHVLMPTMTRTFGYFPARWFRLGEDIPRGIALQWAARRNADPKTSTSWNPDRTEALFKRCASVAGPALVLEFADDAFATKAGTSRFLREFPKIKATRVRISPAGVGLRQVGHFGFFGRRSKAVLWPPVAAYVRTGEVTPVEALGHGSRSSASKAGG